MKEDRALRKKSHKILSTIRNCLEDSKAVDIMEIDLKGKTQEADFMLIATGSSKTQINAISQKVVLELKRRKIFSRLEGLDNCDWVLIDAGDVILNLFRKEVRVFYDLEKLWGCNF